MLYKLYFSYNTLCGGWRVIGTSGSLIWSKSVMKLTFNPCGEFRRSVEDSDKSTLLTSTWCPWNLSRSFKVCFNTKERVGCGNQREATAPIHPWSLSLRWETCLWQNCNLGSWVSSGRPDFGRNCSIGGCICNEGPALYLKLGQSYKSVVPDISTSCTHFIHF